MFSMLYGLVAVSIPPIIHLLSRKRFDIVDWAAMQFLQVSERTRRKVFLEELLLMLIRMLLIALLVLSLAALTTTFSMFGALGIQPSRDVVLVIDGSASMGYIHNGKSAQAAAQEQAKAILQQLQPGDHVGVVLARDVAKPLQPNLSVDSSAVGSLLENLPEPRGGVDWPGAIQESLQLLKTSKQSRREIIILTDTQRSGWSEDRALERWELLTQKIKAEGAKLPSLSVLNVAPDRPKEVTNWSLVPLRAGRNVAAVGREVRFRGMLQSHGPEGTPPGKIRILMDGRPAGEVSQLGQSGERGRLPFSFNLTFATAGSHLVTVQIADDPLAADNRQDFAMEVVNAVPILIIDGDSRPNQRQRTSDFMRDALAPMRDPAPAFVTQVVTSSQFTPEMLTRPLNADPATVPRVLILSDVPRLEPNQYQAVEAFLASGGGVLVTLGTRADAAFANERWYREGNGWLPAELVEPIGLANDLKQAVQLRPASLTHPALERFREPGPGSLLSAYFPRHWKLKLGEQSSAVPIAGFLDGDPLFVERSFGKGRVILSSIGLDNGWRTNLTDLMDYPRMMHELGFYLASGRSPATNLEPGRPIVFTPIQPEPPGPVSVKPPEGITRRLDVSEWPAIDEQTRDPGVYQLTTERGQIGYFVVQSDASESELTPLTDSDKERLAKPLPDLRFADSTETIFSTENLPPEEHDLWWILMLGVVVMMLSEIWFTRTIALRAASGGI
ncbi:vWA domain-containing protein [Tuwongella immobilis]|uniref:VWFA domain-containing protein n=1 Tax=Tuwongella immobilis TaxID=692036 RepID=A0A6C2YS05_9BACT|nr:VWA domain-containing protein [Tuwongella immobilis]VIP04141.1 N-terminal double-transmembrane domain-containing protein OS=Singulisphaera acidiphila (strain ATCC BAA-1392 / DSM 18658 / VKM B-2454 / MOB10) GN=Sinac_7526 PE=4 SV=1: BatA: VWA_2 [Tuwongella immobilis]VTS05647.1 N-terminal double-transmembrane domain-containing protein OS=Singulisphaera acidiphila (strain ATCC BAA-1392 / DSM 18658 / VKM B-2454 / MOB10) GN=Sinac_7526 PE=4 SV=1: BatA: VWA_2 [Tuwongella immobilis]